MEYTLTVTEELYQVLMATLFDGKGVERAAYLTCGVSETNAETRFLVRCVTVVEPKHVISESAVHISIEAKSYLPVLKRAHLGTEAFVFVHSHPEGNPDHSPQDDIEEARLFQVAYIRVRGATVHASLVFSQPNIVRGRVWLPDGSTLPLSRVRIIGDRFRFLDAVASNDIGPWADRQMRALGVDIQSLLSRLTIGIAGVGGTGSAVFEQLVRLGVGRVIVVDPDVFDHTNVNRVYGSRLTDAGVNKVDIALRSSRMIGVGTRVETVPGTVTSKEVAQALRSCDVVFSCTDDQWGRSILTRLAVWYLVPVFDLGVLVDAVGGMIGSIFGRVTTLLPGRACLFCRGRITSDRVRAEVIAVTNPELAEQLRREGYLVGLDEPSPAVIPFTTSVAAAAVTEFLHRLTGCLGADRSSSETLLLISDSRVRTNDRRAPEDCFCGNESVWGRGDTPRFLDLNWAEQ